ncbi:NUDIX domain-containing protein [Pseudonocardia nigra]|uniref:NUDIX domain-containing protein n=1 Tax=Pseudonocardia nigra TaxID=1921578 RepID=UPI0027E37A34|nr:NUDIX domain-containing protein [Pseudonocardia nigra]
MPVLRSTVLIDAPPATVAGLLRSSDLAGAALRDRGHGVTASSRLLGAGDTLDVDFHAAPRVRIPVRMSVREVSSNGMTCDLVGGPLRELTHAVTLTPTAAGTLVLEEVCWHSAYGPLGRIADVAVLRGLVLRVLAARSEALAERAAALAAGPVVVATALQRGGRLLVAQRTRPPALAGRWELPGGRVEAGESEPDAVVRECREELGVPVRVTGRIGTDLPIDAGVLRVHTAELDPTAPDPQPIDHAALRWVGPDEVADVDWVDADRAVVPELVALLEGRAPARTGS